MYHAKGTLSGFSLLRVPAKGKIAPTLSPDSSASSNRRRTRNDRKYRLARYDENDEATHPRPCQELLIMALKNGKPVFIPHAYFGLGDDHFYEAKTVRGNTVAKRVAHKVAGYDDVAWAYLDVPSWWHAKEKDEG